MKIQELLEYQLSQKQKRNALDNKATIIVTMPPEMFLHLTTGPDSDTSISRVADKAKSKEQYQQWMDQDKITVHPFLDIYEKTGWVDRHEGRSRAYTAMKAGDKFYEVAIHLYPYSRNLSIKNVPDVWTGQFNRAYKINFKNLVNSGVIKVLDDNVQKQYQTSDYIHESKSTPVIVVDVQPEYSGMNDGNEKPVFERIIQFVNNQNGPILMLCNAEDQGLSGDTIQDIKLYWEDSGFDPKNWSKIKIYDKGYGYLRSWIDNGISKNTIIKVIRELYQIKKNDSRDIPEGRLKELVGNEWREWMNDDAISVNWIEIGLLRKYNGCYLIGGHEDECLAEVSILMNAFNIKYTLVRELIYN